MNNKIKVLVVEDELLIAKSTAKKLQHLGYEVTNIVSSGAAAIQSIQDTRPDLILMDIAIKGDMDGIEVANIIKSKEDIPIIYLTAYADDITLERASETGCYGYIVKPFKERELHATIKIILNKHQEQSIIRTSLQETLHQYSANYNDIYRDSLTNLPSQLFLRDLFEYLLATPNNNNNDCDSESQIERSPSEKQLLAVFYIHLDRFQKINDSLKPEDRDVLVKNIAKRLTSCVESLDCEGATISLQHHEFLVMLTGFKQRQMASNYGQKILNKLNQSITIEEQEIFISVSVGISFYPYDSLTVEELLQQAKTAMIYAQQQGGNRYHWYTLALNIRSSKASAELALETKLHYALERNEFKLYYQPKVNLLTGKVVGAEALLRWNHPEMGIIAPEKFVPLAEESGLIQPIGEWVLNCACQQTKYWHDAGFKELKIAVNLSGSQFKQSDLFHKITQILFSSAIDPQYLELELTEKILVDNINANVRRLNLLKKLGIQIALDDFGTGYSSLGYLQQFPFDILKIDRCFVRNIDSSSTNAVIAQTIIQMAHRLGLKVVAEGVETIDELNFLKQHQCDEIQGFILSRPLSSREFSNLISSTKIFSFDRLKAPSTN